MLFGTKGSYFKYKLKNANKKFLELQERLLKTSRRNFL